MIVIIAINICGTCPPKILLQEHLALQSLNIPPKSPQYDGSGENNEKPRPQMGQKGLFNVQLTDCDFLDLVEFILICSMCCRAETPQEQRWRLSANLEMAMST